jgi:hypothetical protein
MLGRTWRKLSPARDDMRTGSLVADRFDDG